MGSGSGAPYGGLMRSKLYQKLKEDYEEWIKTVNALLALENDALKDKVMWYLNKRSALIVMAELKPASLPKEERAVAIKQIDKLKRLIAELEPLMSEQIRNGAESKEQSLVARVLKTIDTMDWYRKNVDEATIESPSVFWRTHPNQVQSFRKLLVEFDDAVHQLEECVKAEPIEAVRAKTRKYAERTKGSRKPNPASSLRSRSNRVKERGTGLSTVPEHDQASLRKARQAGVPFAVGCYRRAGLYFSRYSW